MKGLMLRCVDCRRYTLADKCPNCGGRTITVHPSKYSPDDKYARYRTPLAYQDATGPADRSESR